MQPSARTKTPAKKDGGKLNNIMNLIVFFSPAHPPAGGCQPTRKKSYKGIMLNSQHRIAIKKIMLCQQALLIIFFIVPCRRTHASSSGVVNHFLFLCPLLPVGQRQSLRQLCGFANFFIVEYVVKNFIESQASNVFSMCTDMCIRKRKKFL